jgi:hypothetical protein
MNYPYSNCFWDIQVARKRLAQVLAGPGEECRPLEGRRLAASLMATGFFSRGPGRDDVGPVCRAATSGCKSR